MNKSQVNKGISNAVIVVIVAAIAIAAVGGVLGYRYWAQPRKDAEAPKEEAGPQEDWELYRNEERHFEVQYPVGWQVGTRLWRIGVNAFVVSFGANDNVFQIYIYDKPKYVFDGSFKISEGQRPIEDFEQGICRADLSREIVSGSDAIRCTVRVDDDLWVYTNLNNRGVEFRYHYSGADGQKEQYLSEFNHLISTFKFIN